MHVIWLMKACVQRKKPGERFKYTIDRVGRDVFAKKIQDVYNG